METLTKPTYDYFDYLDQQTQSDIAHLSWAYQQNRHGRWYALCGRIVPSWRRLRLADTKHDKVCAQCQAKADRINSRRAARG